MEVALLLLRGGHHVSQHDEVVGVGRQQPLEECLLVLHAVATSAEVALYVDTGIAEPRLVLHGVAVVVGLRRAVLSAQVDAVVGIEWVDAVALEYDVLSAAADDEGLHALLVLSVGRAYDGSESTVAVAGHVERVEDEVHGDKGALGTACHVDVLYAEFCAVASQGNGGLLLGRDSGCCGKQDCYD